MNRQRAISRSTDRLWPRPRQADPAAVGRRGSGHSAPRGPSMIAARRIARVLALWPHELEDESLGGRSLIVARLRQALRAERRRGLSGHWTYDLARHVELLRVYGKSWRGCGPGLCDSEYPGMCDREAEALSCKG